MLRKNTDKETAKNKARLVDVKTIADEYAVTPMTIYKWSMTGRIPSIKIGNKLLRFDPAAVREALANNRAAVTR